MFTFFSIYTLVKVRLEINLHESFNKRRELKNYSRVSFLFSYISKSLCNNVFSGSLGEFTIVYVSASVCTVSLFYIRDEGQGLCSSA